MRAFLLLVSSLVLVVSIYVAGMALTAYAVAEPEPHHFAHMDTPDFWTTKPVAVDRSRQSYERIEAIPALASLPPSDGDPQTAIARTDEGDAVKTSPQLAAAGTAVGDEAATAMQAQPELLDPAHAEWCYGRYRSYRTEDNSYQPFGGGARQQCQSPWTPMTEDMRAANGTNIAEAPDMASGLANEQSALFADGTPSDARTGLQQTAAAGTAPGAHEEWCHERYRSYRIDDNSYQPFDGPRKACLSPHG